MILGSHNSNSHLVGEEGYSKSLNIYVVGFCIIETFQDYNVILL